MTYDLAHCAPACALAITRLDGLALLTVATAAIWNRVFADHMREEGRHPTHTVPRVPEALWCPQQGLRCREGAAHSLGTKSAGGFSPACRRPPPSSRQDKSLGQPHHQYAHGGAAASDAATLALSVRNNALDSLSTSCRRGLVRSVQPRVATCCLQACAPVAVCVAETGKSRDRPDGAAGCANDRRTATAMAERCSGSCTGARFDDSTPAGRSQSAAASWSQSVAG